MFCKGGFIRSDGSHLVQRVGLYGHSRDDSKFYGDDAIMEMKNGTEIQIRATMFTPKTITLTTGKHYYVKPHVVSGDRSKKKVNIVLYHPPGFSIQVKLCKDGDLSYLNYRREG